MTDRLLGVYFLGYWGIVGCGADFGRKALRPYGQQLDCWIDELLIALIIPQCTGVCDTPRSLT
jgi:hypothetical protein